MDSVVPIFLIFLTPVLLSDSDGAEKVVIESSKVTSGDTFVTGEIVIQEPGKYVFKWDNSFSWMNSKTLIFSVERKDPASSSQM